VKITPGDFQAVTGLSRRQFFYSKRSLENSPSASVYFRTVIKQQGRGWDILVSCVRSQVFSHTDQGGDRQLRNNLRRTPTTECNSFIGLPSEGRNITSLRVLEPSDPQIRLAHFVKRDLEVLHWDNCKVKYSPGMAFVFARDMIALSHETSEIVGSYEFALSHFHGIATDCGQIFEPSSTVAGARRKLARKGDFFFPPPGLGEKNHQTEGL